MNFLLGPNFALEKMKLPVKKQGFGASNDYLLKLVAVHYGDGSDCLSRVPRVIKHYLPSSATKRSQSVDLVRPKYPGA